MKNIVNKIYFSAIQICSECEKPVHFVTDNGGSDCCDAKTISVLRVTEEKRGSRKTSNRVGKKSNS